MLQGTLDEQGRFSGQCEVDGKRKETFTNRKLGGAKAKPLCGPFEIEVRGWDRDPAGLEPIGERLNLGIQQIRGTLNTYCGVSIYRDGFRVYPYGQKGNDWLNLDNRSRQNPVKHMANNQIVAAVRLSRDKNPGLRDRSTREGMVLNAEHAALENWFKEVLSLLEEKRYDVRPRRKKEEQSEPLFEAFDVSSAVKQARKELGKDHPVSALLVDTEKQVKAGVDRVQEVFSRLLMSAGLGHMVDIVIHEIGSPLGKINRQLAVMEKRLAALLSDDARLQVDPMETGFRLVFCDDGPGISEENQTRIFEPYFSRKPTGIGLGLYVSRLLIEPYGKLICCSDGWLHGAAFEAVFERNLESVCD